MKEVKLCDKCSRPLWEGLCGYCRGFKDGYLNACLDEEFKSCWALNNLRPLEVTLNRKKYNKKLST